MRKGRKPRGESTHALVLAHLVANASDPDAEHAVPHAICREGVAHALGMTRANAGVLLRALQREGLVVAEHRTVAGVAGRKRLAFFPTEAGIATSRKPAGPRGPQVSRGSPQAPEPPFVGRKAELDRLSAWLRTPEGIVFALVGPPGIGKSALAAQAVRSAPRDLPVFSHVFNNLSTLRNFLLSLADFLAPHGRRELRHFLGSRPAAPVDAAKDALRNALTGFRGVIVLDDAQKMLREVEALVPVLVEVSRANGPKVLFVGRGLPDALAHTQAAGSMDLISLGALDEAESCAFLAGRGFPQDEITDVVAKAAGFPFVLRLAQPGRRRAAWRDVAVYLGELNRDLEPADRLIVQRAAIHRKPVSSETLVPGSDSARLLRLERLGLLSRRAEGWSLHDLLRDFYIGTLQPALAQRLHGEAATHLLARASDSASRENELIEAMFHLRHAGRDEDAVALAIRRGMDLVTKGYTAELYDILQMLRTSHISRRQLGWKCVLEARILTYLGRPSEALAAARQGLAISEDIGDPELMALNAREGGHVFWFTRQHGEGVGFVAQWSRRLRAHDKEPYAADLRNMLGILTHESGDQEGARRIFEENLAYVSAHEVDELLRVKTHANLGKSLRLTGRPDAALPHLRNALATALATGLHVFASTQRLNLAWAHMDLKEYEESARNLEPVLASAAAGPVEEMPEVLWAHGRLLVETGHASRALQPLREARAMYAARNDGQTASQIQSLLDVAARNSS